MTRRRLALALPALLLAVGFGLVLLRPRGGSEPGPPPAGPDPFAGSAACSRCHEAIYDAWQSSHHAQAERTLDFAGFAEAFRPGRTVAVVAIEPVALRHRDELAALLSDPVRLVRIGTAWTLRRSLDPVSPAGRELLPYLLANADHAMGAVRLAAFHKDRGEFPQAARWMRHALRLDPGNPEFLRVLAALLQEGR